jgi:hypothetical protein
MTLISHEIPNSLLPVHDLINDYPYVLAHLVGRDPVYTQHYRRLCKEASYSILDNSAFELGSSVDYQTLYDAALVMNPTHIVIPDIVNDKEGTIKHLKDFIPYFREQEQKNPDKKKKSLIAVIQGKSFTELLDCLQNIIRTKKSTGAPIDTIALPFDTIPGTDYHNIRHIVFRHIRPILEANDLKVHLLGLQNFSEYYLYSQEDWGYIRSVDTSAPIIYGWKKVRFEWGGTAEPKPKDKLADNLNRIIEEEELEIITSNIKLIRDIIHG